MKLTTLLQKMGLIHGGDDEAAVDSPAAAQEERFQTRLVSLADMRDQDRESLSQAQEEALGLHKSFAEIYEEARIGAPTHGISLDDLDRLIQGLPEEEARVRILGIIREKGAPLEEVLIDGQRRDQALDDYERSLEQRVAAWEQGLEEKARALLREASELERQAKELQARVPGLRRELADWKQRKHEEEDLFELLGRMLADEVQKSGGGS